MTDAGKAVEKLVPIMAFLGFLGLIITIAANYKAISGAFGKIGGKKDKN